MPNRAESGGNGNVSLLIGQKLTPTQSSQIPTETKTLLNNPHCKTSNDSRRQNANNQIISNDLVLSTNAERSGMKRLRKRELTFRNSPAEVEARKKALAQAGFYYTGRSDVVQCAFCRGEVHFWKLERDEMEGHAKIFPACRYILQQMKHRESTSRSPPLASDNASDDDDHLKRLRETVEALRLENERLQTLMICSVCRNVPVQTLMLPCRHLATCNGCATSTKRCPKCDKHIERKVQTFMS